MEEPGAVYFTGTAGAGKSTLVQAFAGWLKSAGHDVVTVNLDPGAEAPGLDPDIDIRDWVRLSEVMDEHGLGPNGAQVVAADLIALKVFEIKQVLAEYKTDLILIDSPGQVELFAFRESSRAIVEALSGDRSMVAFLFDPALARSAPGFISLLMLSATVEFRFRLPTVNLLTKSDLLSEADVLRITGWGDDPDSLYQAVTEEGAAPDRQLSTEVFRALSAMAPLSALLPTSATEGRGLEALYQLAMRNFAGAEDLEAPQATPSDE